MTQTVFPRTAVVLALLVSVAATAGAQQKVHP